MERRIITFHVCALLLAVLIVPSPMPAQTESAGARLRDKPHIGMRIDDAQLESEDLHEVMLAGAILKKANLKKANLRLAMMAGADLRGANLQYANLQLAMLLGARLSGAQLQHADFEGANLIGTDFENAQIDGTNFKDTNITQDQLDEACGTPKAVPEGLKMPKPCN